jgi:chromate reductase, NAD(P)H dehydrogenase (quinone)
MYNDRKTDKETQEVSNMKNIIAIGASSSRNSINREFANYSASKIDNVNVKEMAILDYELPLYSIDRETESGIPEKVYDFLNEIEKSDGMVVSLAEHNGSYSAAFKNILDWASRASRSVWKGKPMFLLATSPGPRGGATVHNLAKSYFPHMDARITAPFSLPSFNSNFEYNSGVTDSELKENYQKELHKFQESLGA